MHDDRLKRPNSLASKLYDKAMITCTNIGCSKEFSVDQMNNHEFYECPFRVVKAQLTSVFTRTLPMEYTSMHWNVHSYILLFDLLC